MPNWFAWMLKRHAPPAPRVVAPQRADPCATVAATPPAAPPDDQGASVDLARDFLPWLMHGATPPERELDGVERDTLERLDALLEDDQAGIDLLPRAPAVVPQLLGLLRQENLSWRSMAQRIAADLVLSAEVLRQAGNAAYAARDDDPARPCNLDQALARLGSDDLKSVIARVVLHPLFASSSTGLAARSAARAWEHAERQAQHAAQLAAARGLDRLDAYLAALVHGGSWTMLARAIDRLQATAPALPAAAPPLRWPFGLAFARRLLQRKDALFGRVVAGWRLAPELTALCTELTHTPLGETRMPLGALLVHAEQRAAADALVLQRTSVAIQAALMPA